MYSRIPPYSSSIFEVTSIVSSNETSTLNSKFDLEKNILLPSLNITSESNLLINDIDNCIQKNKFFDKDVSKKLSISHSKMYTNLKKTLSNTNSISFEAEKLIQRPCCDFILNYLFLQCYADLFTMYSVRCEESDQKYWEHVCHLNAYTDDRLLNYLDVDR